MRRRGQSSCGSCGMSFTGLSLVEKAAHIEARHPEEVIERSERVGGAFARHVADFATAVRCAASAMTSTAVPSEQLAQA